jgi:uncharacterized protein (TIGR02271 family)
VSIHKSPKDKDSEMHQGALASSRCPADADGGAHQSALQAGDNSSALDDRVIPVIREKLAVGKRAIETGKGVRVTKTVLEREQIVDEPLAREEALIERVNINEMIAGQDMPTIRYEGETMVVPILEEVLVTEKRTILKEEVRITRKRREVREPQQFVLRTDQVSAEHFDASVAPSAKSGEQD